MSARPIVSDNDDTLLVARRRRRLRAVTALKERRAWDAGYSALESLGAMQTFPAAPAVKGAQVSPALKHSAAALQS
jgi:hypothetical protein